MLTILLIAVATSACDARVRPVAASTFIPHAPIFINGNSQFTSANGVTGGSGTVSDPYIIEGWDINASSAIGIRIENTHAYFVIRNCYVHDGGANWEGIYFSNVVNGGIENSIILRNFHGVSLKDSKKINIVNANVSYNNRKGVVLAGNSNETRLDHVSIYGNVLTGIDLGGSGYGGIIGSQIIGNEGTGIDLKGSSYMSIDGCNVSKNKGNGGIYSGSAVTKVNITNTEVCSNMGNGVELYGATWVNIKNSKFIANAENGISFNSSFEHSNSEISNCTIAGNGDNGVYFYAYSAGGNSYIRNNLIYSNNISFNVENGIYFYAYNDASYPSSSTYVQDNVFCSNAIYSNGQSGIYFYVDYTSYCYIENNTIYFNSIYLNSQSGIYFYTYYSNSYIQNNTIHSNTIHSNTNDGICFCTEGHGGKNIRHNNVYSNFIYSNNQNGIYFSDYPSSSDAYIQYNNIHSNTIYSNNQNGIYFYIRSSGYAPYIQYNNIHSNTIYSNNQDGVFFSADNTYIQNNSIYLNTIYSNNQNGVHFYAYNNVYIQNNNIQSNAINQHSSGSGVIFITDNPAGTWSPSNLYNNTITSNLIGIQFVRIKSHVISSTNISNSGNDGIYLEDSPFNTIHYNTIQNSSRTGVNLINSSNNVIRNNNITGSGQTGISVISSNTNAITHNAITNSSNYGINTISSHDNAVNHNNFIDNNPSGTQAYDDTGTNNWNTADNEGNYWNDWASPDVNGDGIVDNPYLLDGGAGAKDYYPLVNPWDLIPPTIGTPSRAPVGDVLPDQSVKVSVNVADFISGVKNVTLSYTINDGVTWIDLPMNFNSSTNLYEAIIPGQEAGTWVRFKIVAYDHAGNNRTLDGAEPYCVYQVVPEFPLSLFLPLFMIITLMAVIAYKRKHPPL